jgi:hypothetical protein
MMGRASTGETRGVRQFEGTKRPGLKPGHIFGSFGTTEVVPFHDGLNLRTIEVVAFHDGR